MPGFNSFKSMAQKFLHGSYFSTILCLRLIVAGKDGNLFNSETSKK